MLCTKKACSCAVCMCTRCAEFLCITRECEVGKKADTNKHIFRYGLVVEKKKHANYFLLRARRINEL